jgi:hypothetical protein
MTSPRSRRPKRRQRSVAPFVMVHWYILDSQGWHDLSLMARCAYVEVARRYDGANNGMIGMSVRDLGLRLKRSPSHAAKALRELEDAGFITAMKQGTFRRKDRVASEYRLNAFISDIDSDPPDRKWNNNRWNGVTSNTVQWQNQALKDPPKAPQCSQQHCQAQNEQVHSVACDTHIESTRGTAHLDAHPQQASEQAQLNEAQRASEPDLPNCAPAHSLNPETAKPTSTSDLWDELDNIPEGLERRPDRLARLARRA